MKNANQMELFFRAFRTDDNQELIESIVDGYNTIFESNVIPFWKHRTTPLSRREKMILGVWSRYRGLDTIADKLEYAKQITGQRRTLRRQDVEVLDDVDLEAAIELGRILSVNKRDGAKYEKEMVRYGKDLDKYKKSEMAEWEAEKLRLIRAGVMDDEGNIIPPEERM